MHVLASLNTVAELQRYCNSMDLLVLFPLEFLANFPASRPVLEVDSRVKSKLRPGTKSSVLVEEEDASGELKVKEKLRFEFTKIPALLTLKPN